MEDQSLRVIYTANSVMKTSTKKSNGDFVKWAATLAVFMLNMQIGLIFGWLPPNIAWLSSKESPIEMTPSDISWMISVTTLGAPVGAILGSILVEYVGTRQTILATYVISAVSWACLLFANSIEWLYTARLISSLPPAILHCCNTMFLGEVSDQRVRGSLISFAGNGMGIGMLLGIVFETYLPKRVCVPIYLTEALMGTAIIYWLKDTPYILMKKGDFEGAKKSIEFYRSDVNVEEEFDAVQSFVEKSEGIRDKFEKLRAPYVRKSIFVICLVFGLPHLSGGTVFLAYLEIIISKAKVDLIKPGECVIYTIIIIIVATFLTFKLTDKLGRRFLLAGASVIAVLALISLGLHFQLLQSGFDATRLQWLPLISLLVYFMAYAIGFGPVPGILLSEMFPESIKSLASCAATLSSSFFGFAAAKAYQPIVDAFGYSYAFFIFAVFSAVGIPCALFLLIETKGKTFHQIQDELNKA